MDNTDFWSRYVGELQCEVGDLTRSLNDANSTIQGHEADNAQLTKALYAAHNRTLELAEQLDEKTKLLAGYQVPVKAGTLSAEELTTKYKAQPWRHPDLIPCTCGYNNLYACKQHP